MAGPDVAFGNRDILWYHIVQVVDMRALGIWEPLAVKVQTIKTAVESATMLLRIDDIVSGISKKKDAPKQKSGQEVEDHENVDSERMLVSGWLCLTGSHSVEVVGKWGWDWA